MHSAWTSTNLKRVRSSQNTAPDSNFSKEKMRESQQAAGEIIAAVASYVVESGGRRWDLHFHL